MPAQARGDGSDVGDFAGAEPIDVRRARLALFGRADRVRRTGGNERQKESEPKRWIGPDRNSCKTGFHNVSPRFGRRQGWAGVIGAIT